MASHGKTKSFQPVTCQGIAPERLSKSQTFDVNGFKIFRLTTSKRKVAHLVELMTAKTFETNGMRTVTTWNDTNGKGAWERNDWTFAYDFEVTDGTDSKKN